MRLTLRQEWKPRPLMSFLGFIDLKTGVSIALLFAMINKVAGVYGLIAVFTGGTLPQVSMYVYSILGLVGFVWGFRAVAEESPQKTLLTAHLFLLDHLLSTLWTSFFAVSWWIYNPHDGQRPASPISDELIEVGPGHGVNMTDAERFRAAQNLWNEEKGTTAGVLFAGWAIKAYFIALLYSYAVHLRKNTYRSLPLTQFNAKAVSAAAAAAEDASAYQPIFESQLEDEEGNPHDPQRVFDRPRERDIDYDSSDYDSNNEDIERGRGRGIRSGGASMSVGNYGEFVGGSAAPVGVSTKVPGSGGAGNNRRISPKTQARPVVASRPILSSLTSGVVRNPTNPQKQSKSVSPPKPQPAQPKGKSRGIQKELGEGTEEVAWDEEEDGSDITAPDKSNHTGLTASQNGDKA